MIEALNKCIPLFIAVSLTILICICAWRGETWALKAVETTWPIIAGGLFGATIALKRPGTDS